MKTDEVVLVAALVVVLVVASGVAIIAVVAIVVGGFSCIGGDVDSRLCIQTRSFGCLCVRVFFSRFIVGSLLIYTAGRVVCLFLCVVVVLVLLDRLAGRAALSCWIGILHVYTCALQGKAGTQVAVLRLISL